jgi:hypothetical protein
MLKLFKKVSCKFTGCCKSQCSLNAKDTDGDGVVDTIFYHVEKDGKMKINAKVISIV